MKILLCQINPCVGDIVHNTQKIISQYKACEDDVDLLVFPELALTGYQLHDLVTDRDFLANVMDHIDIIASTTIEKKTAILFGTPYLHETGIYNAAICARNGQITDKIFKRYLPNYGVFNEARNFISSKQQQFIKLNSEKIGVLICEDMWFTDVAQNYLEQKVNLIIAINASPYDTIKQHMRWLKAQEIIATCKSPLVYVNLYGGQDALVFDGGTFVLDAYNQYIIPPQYWQEGYFSYCTDTQKVDYIFPRKNIEDVQHIYQALMLSLRDYIHKSKFTQCVLGLSGGIDSALAAAIIADSIGAQNMHCIMMPTIFTTSNSLQDAKTLAQNLQCQFDIIDIMAAYNTLIEALQPIFADKAPDISEENLQARIRGTILMSVANKMQKILIATSNKSETAMGYATLYGDMCGGFALLKDVYKTTVYELAKWRNANIPEHSQFRFFDIIPLSIINKEPSAELTFNQKDSDILPPYELLDQILFAILEEGLPSHKVAEKLQIDINLVKNIKIKVLSNEFKRGQAPIGPKITTKAFNSERKYPIVNRGNTKINQ